jgi:hypothetical protein
MVLHATYVDRPFYFLEEKVVIVKDAFTVVTGLPCSSKSFFDSSILGLALIDTLLKFMIRGIFARKLKKRARS